MGVMPDGPGGVNPDAKYGYTANDGSISGAAGRTQDVVVADLKQRVYEEDFGTNGQWDGIDKMPDGPLLWSVLNALGKSLLKLPGTIWTDVNDLFDGLEWVPERLTEHTAAITTLQQIAAASHSTPAWLADIQDMATFPRVMLGQFGYTFQKYIDIEDGVFCAFDDHYHRTACSTFKPDVTIGSTVGHIYYMPIVADRVGIPAALRWIVGADTSVFSIDFYEMAICAYNPANGNIEKVWTSGDIKDGAASTTSMAEVEIATGLDESNITTPGQILFVAHQQTAPGVLQSARRFAAIPQPGIGRPSSLAPLDACCLVAEDHTQGIPSSISAAALTRENEFLPWAAIAMNTEIGGGT